MQEPTRQKILLTGCKGLVGTALRRALEAHNAEVVGLDIRSTGVERGDILDTSALGTAIVGCTGVVHLAAVSRVIWAEQDPSQCWQTNVEGLRGLLNAAESATRPPWILFASSREVYGQPAQLPATEDTPLRPVNIYGESKVEGERLLLDAQRRGIRTAVVRLSNVYGTTDDHADRVVPAFARAAALGHTLHVEGSDHTFDFTHINDIRRGLMALIKRLTSARNNTPPPIHLLTGKPTSLGQLAALAIQLGGANSAIKDAPKRSYDVSNFYGDPTRAARLINWKPQVQIAEGLRQLIQQFKQEARRAS